MSSTQKKIWYKSYKKQRHFVPAIGCKSPFLDSRGQSVDYAMVRVVKSENCKIAGGRCLISWGLNLTADHQTNQIMAFNADGTSNFAEVVIAC